MTAKDLIFKIFSDENEKKLQKLEIQINLFKSMVWIAFKGFIKMIIPVLLKYMLLVWIFLSIYYNRGFEEAVIIALVGVMIRAGSKNNR